MYASMSGYKSFRKGLDHLLAEDIVQAFYLDDFNSAVPLLGAVGPLQFEVLQYRLRDEYGVESNLEMKQWEVLRWVDGNIEINSIKDSLPHNTVSGKDDRGRTVLLFPSIWSVDYCLKNNPSIKLLDSPQSD